LAHVYCGQMAGWMKRPLGTEVDLGSGHIVLDGVPASPLFSAHVYCGHGRPSQLLLRSCTNFPSAAVSSRIEFNSRRRRQRDAIRQPRRVGGCELDIEHF